MSVFHVAGHMTYILVGDWLLFTRHVSQAYSDSGTGESRGYVVHVSESVVRTTNMCRPLHSQNIHYYRVY